MSSLQAGDILLGKELQVRNLFFFNKDFLVFLTSQKMNPFSLC